jgi:hypothetical protein
MAHKYPPLRRTYDASEPSIDAETMEFRHDRHQQTNVDNVNRAIEPDPHLVDLTIEDLLCRRDRLPESVRISNVPCAESLNPSGRELDMDTWESRRKRGKKDRNLYRGIFYEPPYSIWQAAVVLIVIEICTLLYVWILGE